MHLFKKYSDASKASRWDRWRKIFDLLEDRHVIHISDIIAETDAKPSVIEKDIATLSSRGLVKRTAKGGLTLERYHGEKSYDERLKEDVQGKEIIAALASEKYIVEGMTLFLDGSTTVKAIIPFIANQKLRIITNNLSIISELRKSNFPGEILCTGGHFRSNANTVVGESACIMINRYKSDLTILGVEGVSSEMELMEAHPGEALLKQVMIEHSRRTIILAMPKKFNDDSLLTFATLKDVEALISTRFPPGPFADAAKAQGVRLECPASSTGNQQV
ncbi:DeoR/GlpR transcriptional regulator [Puniceicoccales bacterium CK1056]|uniref:DeoR/GlpR transcriptional regulator n=1 Tax=Oceanipulchritudo coccoides TaxID=2706888 RepID=A0A6B2LYB9_9BACT|nr:DeoR/GlpR family DNA-binding transcription regulator [Oceanipulchritudo coccoides]NDV61631.1 DeoR/GlpR transcriptional regulator [Oceanipulchritudo coccoides]